MIATINGQLRHRDEGSVIVEVGGVGFEVLISRLTSEALPAPDQEIFLHTYLHVREEELKLFGFASAEEKRLFLLLISLSKVGVRTAMDILSTYPVGEFRRIVLQQDAARLTQVPGVGRKTAERVLFELKERIEALPEAHEEEKPAVIQEGPMEEAVQGLVYLGTKYPVAVKAIERAVETLGPDAAVEDLIREGLRQRGG